MVERGVWVLEAAGSNPVTLILARLPTSHSLVSSKPRRSPALRDIEAGVRFYVERPGFRLVFRDDSTTTSYAVFDRDGVEVHQLFQHADEMATVRVRVKVIDPDALAADYASKRLEIHGPLRDTPWRTREFTLNDPDGNRLTFYRALD